MSKEPLMIVELDRDTTLQDGVYAVFIVHTLPNGEFIEAFTKTIGVLGLAVVDDILEEMQLSTSTHYITGVVQLHK